MGNWIKLLRPAQWLKNGIIAAAWLFARWDASQAANALGIKPIIEVAIAMAVFCMLSSAVYIMNDLRDRDSDKLHPTKRLRPIASGAISPATGTVLAIILAVAAFALSFAAGLPKPFLLILAGYALMQVFYTFGLKKIPYVDVFIISIGFVLRAIAGATAISVRISPWLLLCTFLLSLFLALCKRRHEKLLLEDSGAQHRSALEGYSTQLLDMQISIASSATVVCYSIYTLSEETAARFGTYSLGWTIIFVIFGIFRYLDLVYHHEQGGAPEKVLLTDKILILTILGYVVTVLLVFLCH